MKKVLLLMAMLTIGLASINAQDNLRWGATVGMNSSNFSITGFDSKIGFHAGVKAEVGLPQISEGVYLDMGALLTLKGAKIDGGSAASIKSRYDMLPKKMLKSVLTLAKARKEDKVLS